MNPINPIYLFKKEMELRRKRLYEIVLQDIFKENIFLVGKNIESEDNPTPPPTSSLGER